MHSHYRSEVLCEDCGVPFIREDGRRNSRTCPSCKKIYKMEREAIKEWEEEQGFTEDD